MGKIKNYLFWAIFLAVINLIFIFVFNHQNFQFPDTECYVRGAKLIFHLPGGTDCSFRMIKPFPLIFAGLFELITQLDAKYGFLLQNIIFYFLSVILIYKIIDLVFKDKLQALIGTVVFVSAPPVVLEGIAYLTDFSGWFFVILITYLTLKIINEEKVNYLLFWLIGFLNGLGFLFKESALGSVVFFIFFIFLIRHFNLAKKLKTVFAFSLGFFIPIIIFSAIVYHYFHYSFLTWYQFNQQKPFGNYYNLWQIIKAGGGALYLFWFWFAIGVLKFWKEIIKPRKFNSLIFSFTIASFPTSLIWLIWSYPLSRILFLASPFLVSLVSYGLTKFKNLGFWLAILTWILNLAVIFFYLAYKISFLKELFLIYTLIFLIIILIFKPNPQPFSQHQ